MIISTTNKGYNSASITANFNIETAQAFYEVHTHNGKEYKSIKRVNHFDGWQTVAVYYDNGVKTEYFIKSH